MVDPAFFPADFQAQIVEDVVVVGKLVVEQPGHRFLGAAHLFGFGQFFQLFPAAGFVAQCQKDEEAAQEQLLSAIRIYGCTSAIQAFTDAMTEAGILPSPYGQTVPTEQPAKTGLEKRR